MTIRKETADKPSTANDPAAGRRCRRKQPARGQDKAFRPAAAVEDDVEGEESEGARKKRKAGPKAKTPESRVPLQSGHVLALGPRLPLHQLSPTARGLLLGLLLSGKQSQPMRCRGREELGESSDGIVVLVMVYN